MQMKPKSRRQKILQRQIPYVLYTNACVKGKIVAEGVIGSSPRNRNYDDPPVLDNKYSPTSSFSEISF